MRQLSAPLLRAVIRFEQEDEGLLASNLYHIRHELEPGAIDKHIFDFISDIYDKTHLVPTVQLVTTHYKELETRGDGNGVAGLARISMLVADLPVPQAIPFLSGAEFRYELDRFKDELLREETSNMLLQAGAILTTGARVDGQTSRGALPALEYLSGQMNQLTSALKRGSIEGSFRRDANIVKKQYDHWKHNQASTVGCLTGIDRFDVVHRGAKNGDLVLVAGFVSHLKTSFVLNWLYRTAVDFSKNGAIASLEMPISTLRMLLYIMHTGNARFKGIGEPLDYDRVTTGSLTSEEEVFFNQVIEDFETNPEYGEIYYKEPEASITLPEIQRWAEKKHQITPLDMLVIDYLGLVDPGKGQSSLDSVASLNKVMRQAKMVAMTFNQGRGIPIISPFQTNREGLKEAEKNGGRYKITALAGSNEAERSSDLVYFTYLDDTLRNSREVLLGNLKARNSAVVTEPFKAYANPATRTIANLDTSGGPADLVTI